jgi:hypothetical protein
MKLLEKQKEGTEIMVIGGGGDSYIVNMGNQANEYDYRRTKKNIKVIYIGGEKERAFLDGLENDRPLFKYKYIPEVLSGITNITIFEDQALVMYIFDETVTKIIIRNKKIVESYTGFFKGLWKMAK